MSFIFWRRNTKCFIFIFVLLLSGYIIISNIWNEDNYEKHNNINNYNEDLMHPGVCKRPKMELWSEDIKKIFENLDTVNCSTNVKKWTSFNKGKFQICEEAVEKHGPISCNYKKIIRLDGDMGVNEGPDKGPIKLGDDIPHDVISVKCAAEDGVVESNIVLGVKPKPEKIFTKHSQNGLDLNIIMFGFDSVSSLTWKRSLPMSYNFFLKIGGVVLDGYNIVGDGTPQALLPILTGKTEEELPEARRGFSNAKSVDDHPWIWKDLHKRGYVTQWGEDGAAYGTFTYRMMGFSKQPVDHYIRPFYLFDKSISKNCFGTVASHKLQLNYMKEFLEVYGQERKMFSFLFHSDYSHDSSKLLSNADNDLYDQLVWLNNSRLLDKSLLILMSDHGARFTNLRSTEQGKYEERLPFFGLRLPSTASFKNKFPGIHDRLVHNSKLLTTPFDIHETMMDVLNYEPSTSNFTMSRPYPRGISLFRDIPTDRSCEDANIMAHWCTCMNWLYEPLDSPIVKEAAEEAINKINLMTANMNDMCATLKLLSIKSASVIRTRSELLSFKGAKDKHGRVADFSDNMKSAVELYQVSFTTSPNNAVYEATLTYDIGKKEMFAHQNQISRSNAYGKQSRCISDTYPHLRAYCYCK